MVYYFIDRTGKKCSKFVSEWIFLFLTYYKTQVKKLHALWIGEFSSRTKLLEEQQLEEGKKKCF